MTRCEGWTRTGGAFSFGPPEWSQCTDEATVSLVVVQDGQRKGFPACNDCWATAIARGIDIEQASPIRDGIPAPSLTHGRRKA